LEQKFFKEAYMKKDYTKWRGWLIDLNELKKGVERPISKVYPVTAPTPYAAKREVAFAFLREKGYDPTKYRVGRLVRHVRIRNLADERTPQGPEEVEAELIASLSGATK